MQRLAEPARTLPGGERNRVRYDPAGVAAVSTPWNAPFMLATWRVGPALAAGDTVVLKPPEWAPLTCSLLGDLAEQAGLPPGVLNIVHGTGAGAGAPLTGHRDVDRVAFTGSPATAHTVYRDAAANLTPVSFELGGKSPFIVFEDADLDAAAATAAYQYDNSGQVCLAGTRLLVQRSIVDDFLERFEARAGEIRVGDPRDPGTTFGPLIHPVALERVTGYVERAFEAGANLAFGGRPISGLYYPPTLFTDVPADAEILRAKCLARCSRSRRSSTRPRRSTSQTPPTTGSRPRSTPALRSARTGSAPRSSPARFGSTASTCAISRRRSAARATRASAARAATTRSTSTPT